MFNDVTNIVSCATYFFGPELLKEFFRTRICNSLNILRSNEAKVPNIFDLKMVVIFGFSMSQAGETVQKGTKIE